MRDAFQQLMTTLEDPCFLLDGVGGILDANAAAVRLFSPAKHLRDFLPEDFLTFFQDHRHPGLHRKVCDEGSAWLQVFEDFSFLRMRGPDVMPAGLFQRITENLQEWLYIVEPDFRVIWANALEVRNMIGVDFRAIVPEALHDNVNRRMKQMMAGEVLPPYETRVETPEGVRWYRASWIPVWEVDHLSHVGIFVRDVTAQKEHDEALVRSESRYRTVLNNSLDIVALFSASHRLQFVTPNIYETLGYRAEDLVGEEVDTLLTREDLREVAAKVKLLRARPALPVSFEAKVRRADGTYAWVEARVRVTEPGVEGAMLICNARDVTARRELEAMRQQLIRADKLAAVGQVAAGVAHEINNPASYIYTNLFVLREYLTQFADKFPLEAGSEAALVIADMKHMIDVNLQGMDRISHIVRELRMFSRDDSENIEHVDLHETIDAAVHLVRNQIEHIAHLHVDVAADVRGIVSDRGKLAQVLVNILVNAGQAISDSPARDHEVKLTCRQEGAEVVITISDTGPGMAPDVLARIFEPFYTTKTAERGTGLGLWLCDEIVRKLGGRMEVESQLGKGSTFIIRLPRSHGQQEVEVASLEETTDTEYMLRVLVVDDDELVLQSVQKMLLSQGHEAIIAPGGTQAITLLTKDDAFDAIICDVMMPSVDGLQLYEHIGRHHPHLLPLVVFCTAGVLTQAARRFLSRADIRVLQKPISANLLHDVLRMLGSMANKKAPEEGRLEEISAE
ncbi:MAG: PAS domain S-box protein [bacterium]